MGSFNANQIGEATVRITADTSQVGPAIDEAKAKVQSLESSFNDKALGAAAIAATAVSAYKLGRELEALAEKYLGLKDNAEDVFKAIDEASRTPVESAKARISELRHELLDESAIGEAARIWTRIWGAVNGLDLEGAIDQSRIKAIENTEARLANARATAAKEDLQKRIAQEEASTVEGAERIERHRQEAIRRAKLEFKDLDPESLIASINRRYDAERSRLAELEAKKAEADARQKEADEERDRQSLLAIEDRKRAYNDLIQFQKQRDREHAEALAESIAKAMKSAYSEMTRSLALDRLVTTMEALNANMEKLTRQRFAMG